MRPSSDIPGVEARAWYSPSQETYYVQRWGGVDDMLQLWVSREGSPGPLTGSAAAGMHSTRTVPLPDDAFEIGGNPTEWAYARACEALHKHASRADQAEGRIERLRQHLMLALGMPNLPLESLVDLLAVRAGMASRQAPARPPTFDTALSRLSEIAGDRADPSSTWATVRGAMTAAAASQDTNLFREVIELASAVRVPVQESERSPAWLKS